MRGVDWLGEDLLLLALDAGRRSKPLPRSERPLCASVDAFVVPIPQVHVLRARWTW